MPMSNSATTHVLPKNVCVCNFYKNLRIDVIPFFFIALYDEYHINSMSLLEELFFSCPTNFAYVACL